MGTLYNLVISLEGKPIRIMKNDVPYRLRKSEEVLPLKLLYMYNLNTVKMSIISPHLPVDLECI